MTVHALHVGLASGFAFADCQVTQNIACVSKLYFVGICYIAYSPADCRPSKMQKLQQRLPLLTETLQSSCLLGSCNVSRSATTCLCSVKLKLPLPNRGNKKSVQPGLRHCKIRCASKGDQACCVFCTLFCTHTMSNFALLRRYVYIELRRACCHPIWGCSSYGRALTLHVRGTGIDALLLHCCFYYRDLASMLLSVLASMLLSVSASMLLSAAT